jgi:hypothetical protein
MVEYRHRMLAQLESSINIRRILKKKELKTHMEMRTLQAQALYFLNTRVRSDLRV